MKRLKKLSKAEEKVYEGLRKVHYKEHEKVSRWWCVHCKVRKIRQEEIEPESYSYEF